MRKVILTAVIGGLCAFSYNINAQQQHTATQPAVVSVKPLTAQQQQQARLADAELREKQKDLQTEIKTKRRAMKTELLLEMPNRKAINRLVSDINFLQNKQLLAEMDHAFKLRDIMLLEQYKAYISQESPKEQDKKKADEKQADTDKKK